MAAHLAEDVGTAATAFHICIEQTGTEFVLCDQPGGVDRLLAEVRMLASDTLAPRGEALRFQLYQEDAAAGGQAEAGLERMSQGHVDLAHVDGIDIEHVLFSCLSNRMMCE